MTITPIGENTFFCDDENSVALFAELLARVIGVQSTIGFSGDLGAGKTTLIRSLCAALGSTTPVASPTYVLSFEYTTSTEQTIEHWDLYRVCDLIPELLEPPSSRTIRLIEWPERMSSWGEAPDVMVTLGFGESATERTIAVWPPSIARRVREMVSAESVSEVYVEGLILD